VSYPFWVVVALDLAQRVSEFLIGCIDALYRYLCILIIGLYSAVGVLYVIGRIAGVPFTSGSWERYPLFVTYLVHEVGSGGSGWFKIVLVLLPLSWAVCSVAGLVDSVMHRVPEPCRGHRWTGIKVGVLFSMLFLGVQGGVLPVISAQTSGKVFAQAVVHTVGSAPVVSFGQEFYSLSYYSHVRMNSRDERFFFDEWVVLAKNDVRKLEGLLGEGQAFEVRASEPPGLKDGREVVLGRIIKTASRGGRQEGGSGTPIGRY
jgi:hypothetical protein